jgi:hypothetical protein
MIIEIGLGVAVVAAVYFAYKHFATSAQKSAVSADLVLVKAKLASIEAELVKAEAEVKAYVIASGLVARLKKLL